MLPEVIKQWLVLHCVALLWLSPASIFALSTLEVIILPHRPSSTGRILNKIEKKYGFGEGTLFSAWMILCLLGLPTGIALLMS